MASHRLEQQMTVAGLPQTGSLQREWRRCGRPTCRCTSGMLHGPYWLFGVRGRQLLRQRCELLPPHTAYATRQLLDQVESHQECV
jgi:hypothetical protein